MDEIVKDFLIESNENLDRLDQELVKLESEPSSKELLASVFRTIHTIKGSCGFLGFARLEKLAHAGESLLSRLRDGKLTLTRRAHQRIYSRWWMRSAACSPRFRPPAKMATRTTRHSSRIWRACRSRLSPASLRRPRPPLVLPRACRRLRQKSRWIYSMPRHVHRPSMQARDRSLQKTWPTRRKSADC